MAIRKFDLRSFAARYHRNGVAGEGFYLCSFLFTAGKRVQPLQATVFDAPGRVAVFDPEDIRSRWRGDDFEPAIREALTALEAAEPYCLYQD